MVGAWDYEQPGAVRKVPVVIFPVAVRMDGRTPETVAANVQECIRLHAMWLAGAAEIARRNGGGGHMTVWNHRDEEGTVVDGWLSMAVSASWTRERVAGEPAVVKEPPSQRCFGLAWDLQCEWFHGRGTLRIGTRGFLADELARVERLGVTPDVLVWCAMDGGTGRGRVRMLSKE